MLESTREELYPRYSSSMEQESRYNSTDVLFSKYTKFFLWYVFLVQIVTSFKCMLKVLKVAMYLIQDKRKLASVNDVDPSLHYEIDRSELVPIDGTPAFRKVTN